MQRASGLAGFWSWALHITCTLLPSISEHGLHFKLFSFTPPLLLTLSLLLQLLLTLLVQNVRLTGF